MTLNRLLDKEIEGCQIQSCLGCNSCTNVCPVSGFEDMNPSKLIQLIIDGENQVPLNTKWIWYCCQCGNCKAVCPMDIPIPSIIHILKSLQPEEMLPSKVRERLQKWKVIGNTSSIYPGDYISFIKKAEAIIKKKTGKILKIPIDKRDSKVFLLVDPEILKEAPEVLSDYALIFHKAKESWTIPSTPLGTFDPFIMAGRADLANLWIDRVYDLFKTFKFQRLLIDDCQNRLSLFSPQGDKKFFPVEFEIINLSLLIKEYLKKGTLKLKKRKTGCQTFQIPCGLKEENDQRTILSLMRELFNCVRNMTVPIENSNCCGGSLLRMGLKDLMSGYDSLKILQLKQIQCDGIITVCATCFLKFLQLKEEGMINKTCLFLPQIVSELIIS